MTADTRLFSSPLDAIDARSRALWPQIDSDDLEACRADLACVTDAASRATGVATSTARVLLQLPTLAAEEAESWCG